MLHQANTFLVLKQFDNCFNILQMSIEKLSEHYIEPVNFHPPSENTNNYAKDQIQGTLALKVGEVTMANWRELALCKDPSVDKKDFFSDKPESIKRAKEVCDRCPVVLDCLEYALDHRREVGVWGGTTDRQRVRLRQKRSREADKSNLV